MTRPRLVLASASVALVLTVVGVAVALGPDSARKWLLLAAGLAVIASIQSVAADPRDLTTTLLLALLPVAALLADGCPTWMIGPLGAFLFVAAELNALSWDCQGSGPLTAVKRVRLLKVAPLAALGLASALAIGGIAATPVQGGILAIALVGLALAALGRVLF